MEEGKAIAGKLGHSFLLHIKLIKSTHFIGLKDKVGKERALHLKKLAICVTIRHCLQMLIAIKVGLPTWNCLRAPELQRHWKLLCVNLDISLWIYTISTHLKVSPAILPDFETQSGREVPVSKSTYKIFIISVQSANSHEMDYYVNVEHVQRWYVGACHSPQENIKLSAAGSVERLYRWSSCVAIICNCEKLWN